MDSDHRPTMFQLGFIQRGAVEQPQTLGHSPGALCCGAHNNRGTGMGNTRRRDLPTLCVNSPKSLPLSAPQFACLSRAWAPCSLGESTNVPQSFPGLLWAPGPKLPPRISGLIGPDSHSKPLMGSDRDGQPPLTSPSTRGSPRLLLMAPGSLVAFLLPTPHPVTPKKHPPLLSHPDDGERPL